MVTARPYGQALAPRRLELTSLALSALQHLGFKSTQAQQLVDAVLAINPVPADPAGFIRAALRLTR
jgi:Holliday junction resolvasome RuvABC DNA-binding subunit